MIPIAAAHGANSLAVLPADFLHRQSEQHKFSQYILKGDSFTFVKTDLTFPRIDLRFLMALSIHGGPVEQVEIGIQVKPGRFQAAVAGRFHGDRNMPPNPDFTQRIAQQFRDSGGFEEVLLTYLFVQIIDFSGVVFDRKVDSSQLQIPYSKEHTTLLPVRRYRT
jgi:hypothetical protein